MKTSTGCSPTIALPGRFRAATTSPASMITETILPITEPLVTVASTKVGELSATPDIATTTAVTDHDRVLPHDDLTAFLVGARRTSGTRHDRHSTTRCSRRCCSCVRQPETTLGWIVAGVYVLPLLSGANDERSVA